MPLGEVDVFDTATDSWSVAPDLPRPKCWLGAAVIEDGSPLSAKAESRATK